MFECAITMLCQLITFIPYLIALWLVFEWIGNFFFGCK